MSSNACQSNGYTQVSVNDQLQQMSLNIYWEFSFRADLTFQRLLYKIFPTIYQRECSSNIVV